MTPVTDTARRTVASALSALRARAQGAADVQAGPAPDPLDSPAPDALAAAAWTTRLTTLAGALGRPDRRSSDPVTAETVGALVASIIDVHDRSQIWLALAVLSGAIPADHVVAEVARESEFDHGAHLGQSIALATTRRTVRWAVRVTQPDEVLVDVSATLPLTFTTGIQRVIRETVPRWMETFGAHPVAWAPQYAALRDLTYPEQQRMVTKTVATRAPEPVVPATVIVPWGCTYLTPEVLAETARANQVRSLALYSRCRTGALTYDCVPLTSSETLIDWGGDTFAWHLSALRSFDQLAAISESAADEYRGWRRALAGIGRTGPDVDAVLLPVEVADPDEAVASTVRQRFLVRDLPLVLVVGSAEPRKNQLAVLHAAELLWREGKQFSLTFVGGRSWGAGTFAAQVDGLQAAGRPVEIASGVSDAELFAAYRLARFTVFPSLNEGFGLPVAESLACHTPVVTSSFGSMKEIADGGGALTVDPRSSVALRDAMRQLLDDDALLAELTAAAADRPARTWDMYAKETWQVLVG